MKEYIEFLLAKHRATRAAFLKEGKTYRSRFVAQENGAINALTDVLDAINQPIWDQQLRQGMATLSAKVKD